MKLQCGTLAIILVGILCLGTGFGIGKLTQPITVNNISTSESTSISSSSSMAGSILIQNGRRTEVLTVKITGFTNIQMMNVTNGVTNIK